MPFALSLGVAATIAPEATGQLVLGPPSVG
jgi:hypothetical protein